MHGFMGEYVFLMALSQVFVKDGKDGKGSEVAVYGNKFLGLI